MRQRIIEVIIISLLLLIIVGGVYWYVSRNPQMRELVLVAWERVLVELELATPEAEKTGIAASGFIEVRQVAIASEVSGRLVRLMVDEGDQVNEDQVLAEIDADILDAQIDEAEAAVAMAEAQLARVEAGARTEDIALAAAAATMAEAQRDATYQAWRDAMILRDNPQELELQIAATRSQIAVLEQRIQQMVALKDAAELMDDLRERQTKIAEEGVDYRVKIPGVGTFSGHADFPEGDKRQAWAGWNLATTDLWGAWVNLGQAIAARDAGRQNLSDLLALRDNPQQAQVQVAQAEAAYQQAVVGVEVAKANLDLVRAGATQEQIEVAHTRMEQAQAALDALNVQRQKYSLQAPITGLVVEKIAHEGEIALTGVTLLTLADLNAVDLTVYVPEPDLGQVLLDQPVEVSVDSFPGEVFSGQVVWISDEAEFTPKNIQTKEERVNTVFAVKVRIPNPDHKLKPGMPADAKLLTRQASAG